MSRTCCTVERCLLLRVATKGIQIRVRLPLELFLFIYLNISYSALDLFSWIKKVVDLTMNNMTATKPIYTWIRACWWNVVDTWQIGDDLDDTLHGWIVLSSITWLSYSCIVHCSTVVKRSTLAFCWLPMMVQLAVTNKKF